MAERIKVSESWLTRYLDLARLPEPLMAAFPDPQALTIRNVIALKPLLKPDDKRERVFQKAAELGAQQKADGKAMAILDVIRMLSEVAPPPSKSGSPNRSGSPVRSGSPQVISSASGQAVLRVERADRKGVCLTLLNKGGASREDAEKAIREILDRHWA
jgi:ParB family chromosome partitioning protein